MLISLSSRQVNTSGSSHHKGNSETERGLPRATPVLFARMCKKYNLDVENHLEKHQLILYDKLFVSCSGYRNQQENPIVIHTIVRIRFCWHVWQEIEIDPCEWMGCIKMPGRKNIFQGISFTMTACENYRTLWVRVCVHPQDQKHSVWYHISSAQICTNMRI